MINRKYLIWTPFCVLWCLVLFFIVTRKPNPKNKESKKEIVKEKLYTHGDSLEVYTYEDGSTGSLPFQPKHIDVFNGDN